MIRLKIPDYKKVFNDNIYKNIHDYKSRIEVHYGGGSSGKSHGVYQKVIIKALRKWDKPRKILVLRKIGSSVSDSCFEHIISILSDFKIINYCKINQTKMTITLPNGAKFLFKGLDNNEKIKSIKGISDIVMEEATEFTLNDFTQLNIRLRDNYPYKQLYLMFNPVSKKNWVYDYFFLKKTEAKIYFSNYANNRFIDDITKQELEKLKERNPAYYTIYTLGEFATLERLIFQYKTELLNVTGLPLYVGCDFGYVNDPSAIIETKYDEENKIIYITREYVKKNMLNDEIAEKIKLLGLQKEVITADSAEPKSIDEIKRQGIHRIKGSTKGPDSVMHGIQWLLQHTIIIDERCFKTIEEFDNYTWRKDRQGEYINEPIDSYNHCIDALRYAYSDKIKGKRPVRVISKRELGI